MSFELVFAALSRARERGQGGVPPCWRAQTAASAHRGSGSSQGQQDSANLVSREAEGDTGAKAG